MPVAFAIGLSSVATILAAGLPVAVVFQKMVGGMQVFSFLAIPFFIFAGELMLHGGIADRIVRFANSLVGHVRGGLGMSNVLGCTLFGGVAGSPLADVSAMGSVMIPLMKKEGYDADYAVNVTTHASLVGALMPTSHNLIIFTLATAGIAVGQRVQPDPGRADPGPAADPGQPGRGLWRGGQARLPDPRRLSRLDGRAGRLHRRRCRACRSSCIILAGILSGVFTATESAATAVFWALLDHRLVYRSLSWTNFLKACAKACKTTGVVLLLIGISVGLRLLHGAVRSAAEDRRADAGDHHPALADLPDGQRPAVRARHLSGHGGHHPDLHADLPADLPAARHGPHQFGIMMLINCALGLNTPPVGSTQFVGCAIGGISVGEVMRSIAPFYGALIATLMLVTYVPAFSLWLPGLFN